MKIFRKGIIVIKKGILSYIYIYIYVMNKNQDTKPPNLNTTYSPVETGKQLQNNSSIQILQLSCRNYNLQLIIQLEATEQTHIYFFHLLTAKDNQHPNTHSASHQRQYQHRTVQIKPELIYKKCALEIPICKTEIYWSHYYIF
jgi:hypothetical protein